MACPNVSPKKTWIFVGRELKWLVFQVIIVPSLLKEICSVLFSGSQTGMKMLNNCGQLGFVAVDSFRPCLKS